ncbi:hypothetical protein D3C78_1128610 [compost metagenome]
MEGRTERQCGQGRDHHQQRQGGEQYREALAGRFLPGLGPTGQDDNAHQYQDQADEEGPEAFRHGRCRHVQAAIVEEEVFAQAQALSRPGHGQHHGEVPEEDLQQRRNVAEGLDVDGRQFAYQPVRREPRHPEDEAEDGREEDADDRNQQGIEQTDDEDPAVAVAFVVVDQMLGDTETGALLEEVEAGENPAFFQVGLGVLEQVPAQCDDRDDRDDLK